MNILKMLNDKLEEYFLVITLTLSVILIFAQVIMRYVFSASLSWSEELARYLFLWQIWIGASFAAKNEKHLRTDILKTAVPNKYKNYVELIALIIWLAFSIFLTYKSSLLVMSIGKTHQLSPAMRMPMTYAYASVPFGCGLMSIRLIQKMYLNFKDHKNGGAL